MCFILNFKLYFTLHQCVLSTFKQHFATVSIISFKYYKLNSTMFWKVFQCSFHNYKLVKKAVDFIHLLYCHPQKTTKRLLFLHICGHFHSPKFQNILPHAENYDPVQFNVSSVLPFVLNIVLYRLTSKMYWITVHFCMNMFLF